MTTKILSGIYIAAYNLNAPITTLSIAAGGYLAAGLAATGPNAYTVVNNGGIRAVYNAVSLAGGGVVSNTGSIRATSTMMGAGVILGNGGTVTNAAGAVIDGYFGIAVAAQAGTINNQGAIAGNGKYGIQLADGGVVTNGATADTAASIRGAVAIELTLAATVHNYGTVLGMGTTGIAGYLMAGGLVTNGSAGDTAAAMLGTLGGVEFKGASGTFNNFGLVRATGTSSFGVAFQDGGTVINGSASDTGATIQGQTYAVAVLDAAGSVTNFGTVRASAALSKGVLMGAGGAVINGGTSDTTALIESAGIGVGIGLQAGTVNNFGTIIGGYGAGNGVGVYLGKGGVVINGSAADLTAKIGSFIGAYIKSATGTIDNFGTIGGAATQIGAVVAYGGVIVNGSATDTTALIQGYAGAATENHAGTVNNFGTIIGGGGPASFIVSEGAVILTAGGVVNNGSSADTKASLTGEFGIIGQAAAITVGNFGGIYGAEVGIYSKMGGKVTNGSGADTTASIGGSVAGVDILGAVGTVINFGTIAGGSVVAAGVGLTVGGVVTNGGKTDQTALIHGFIGVDAVTNVAVGNFGTISGNSAMGSVGVNLLAGSSLTNNAGAFIDGYAGVYAAAGVTATNFGTIEGFSGKAVVLAGPTSRLNAEAGSVIEGVIVVSAAGLVDVVSGVASASAVDTGGKIEGVGTLSLAGGDSFLDAGVSLLNSQLTIGTGETVHIETKLTDSRIWNQTAGTLFIDSGDQLTLTGSANSLTGTVTGLGTLFLDGGADALTDLTLSAGKMSVTNAAVTLSGAIDLTGALSVASPNLIVANAGATLSGGGTIALSNAATNSLRGASAAATLTNGDIIRGAGKLGGGTMTLINTAAGTIENGGSVALTLDTGTNTIANAGLIEALGGGGMAIKSAIANTGALTCDGTMTFSGSVTGSGIVKVIGGVADFTSALTENVAFGSSGRLVLGHGQAYGGTISGFSHTGTNSLDLSDIAFGGTTVATYSGTAASGILTVTDGTHTANIHLTGNYLAATWTLSAAVGGGTHVIDPTAPQPKIAPLVAAMAGFGAGRVAATALSSQAWMAAPPLLAVAHPG